jgi:hypothetical protein
MLREWLTYLLTPHTPETGAYLRESLAIEARYRRCRKAWQPHLERCRQQMVQHMPPGGGKAVILGSGALLDVPLPALAQAFAEVCLVDIVHPLSTRRQARGFPNIRLVEADLGGTSHAPLPESEGADFIVSVNLLSQLPLCGGGAPTPNARAVIEAHLQRLQQAPGTRLLITDRLRQCLDRAGNIVEEQDALHGATLPAIQESWWWEIAPIPELSRTHRWRHQVAAVTV